MLIDTVGVDSFNLGERFVPKVDKETAQTKTAWNKSRALMITTRGLPVLLPLLTETTQSCSVLVTETRDAYLQLFFLHHDTNIHFNFL